MTWTNGRRRVFGGPERVGVPGVFGRGRLTWDDVRRRERLEEEVFAVDEEARVAEDALALGRAQREDVDGFGRARPGLGVGGVRNERLVAAPRRGAPGFIE